MRRTPALVLVAACLLAGCAGRGSVTVDPSPAVLVPPPVPETVGPPTSIALSRPRPDITPGVVLTTAPTDVCTPGWASAHRQTLTDPQRRAVLAAYHFAPTTKVAEWDHLISLELGGGNGPGNIWPDLSHTDQARKDRLEGVLHQQVCTGRLALITAQAEIKQYWRYW